MRLAIPRAYGGIDLPPLFLHQIYEAFAASSLATALIISQRDSAIAFIEATENEALKRELLPQLCAGEIFTTIGIAQLTTSRQGGAPSLLATKDDDGWRLNGIIPWSTGADRARVIVVGAAVAGSQDQLLIALRTGSRGLTIGGPMNLVALRASRTSSIDCADVFVPTTDVLRGPMPAVLSGRKRSLPIGQAFLAMGLCRGAIELMRSATSTIAGSTADAFAKQLSELHAEVMAASTDPPTFNAGETHSTLRGRCNDLAVRVTHAAVALFKGSGLLAGHPAQRLAREAMFLLVWSCPAPVVECTIDRLSCV